MWTSAEDLLDLTFFSVALTIALMVFDIAIMRNLKWFPVAFLTELVIGVIFGSTWLHHHYPEKIRKKVTSNTEKSELTS